MLGILFLALLVGGVAWLVGKQPTKKKQVKKRSPKKKGEKSYNNKSHKDGTVKKKKAHRFVGKVGWCNAATLGLDDGHYVFIRRVYGDKCSVNTFTSLKGKNGYKTKKIKKIENGEIYPIPKKDLTLRRFSGVHNNTIKNVPLANVENIGKHSLRRRHHHYIQKYVKK